jgi:hypothetical protein
MDNPPPQGTWIETPSVKLRKTSDDAGVPLRGLFLRALAAPSGTPIMQSGGWLVGGTSPHLRAGRSMQIPGNNANDSHREQSQDAVRHQKDALHHKFHNGRPASESDQKADQQSQARAQQDSVDMQQIEGQQPEIPKVGSLDAPGG